MIHPQRIISTKQSAGAIKQVILKEAEVALAGGKPS